MEINAVVLVGQVILSGILVWVALRRAPVDIGAGVATTAAQYAQAAKLKAEENAVLQGEIDALTHRLELVERKKYRIIMEFTIGDPPEMGKVIIEPMIEPITTPVKKVGREKKL